MVGDSNSLVAAFERLFLRLPSGLRSEEPFVAISDAWTAEALLATSVSSQHSSSGLVVSTVENHIRELLAAVVSDQRFWEARLSGFHPMAVQNKLAEETAASLGAVGEWGCRFGSEHAQCERFAQRSQDGCVPFDQVHPRHPCVIRACFRALIQLIQFPAEALSDTDKSQREGDSSPSFLHRQIFAFEASRVAARSLSLIPQLQELATQCVSSRLPTSRRMSSSRTKLSHNSTFDSAKLSAGCQDLVEVYADTAQVSRLVADSAVVIALPFSSRFSKISRQNSFFVEALRAKASASHFKCDGLRFAPSQNSVSVETSGEGKFGEMGYLNQLDFAGLLSVVVAILECDANLNLRVRRLLHLGKRTFHL